MFDVKLLDVGCFVWRSQKLLAPPALGVDIRVIQDLLKQRLNWILEYFVPRILVFTAILYMSCSSRSTTTLCSLDHLLLCCLPTPMTFASGGSPMFPLVVHQPASPSTWPAVQSLRRGLFTNPGVTMWCVCGCSWRDHVCRVCGCYRGGIVVMDVFWCRLCVSMIWGREICLFWAGQGCDEWGGVMIYTDIYRYIYIYNVCIWRMFVFMSVVVTVWGSVGMFVV